MPTAVTPSIRQSQWFPLGAGSMSRSGLPVRRDARGAGEVAHPRCGTVLRYEAGSIDEVCEAALTTGIDPIAVGDANVRFNDNFDNYEAGSRTNAFGGNANGTVYDADGNAWSFHGNLKLKIDKDGNFEVVKETIRLNRRGN